MAIHFRRWWSRLWFSARTDKTRQWQSVLRLELLEDRTVPAVLPGGTINVTSSLGGHNYAANVTIGQLNPNITAITLRDAINAANNTAGNDTIVLQANTHYDL